MAKTTSRSKMHVEGIDDLHSIVHLLKHNNVNYNDEKFDLSPPELPQFEIIKSVEEIIRGIETAVKTGTGRTMGFLMDADVSLINRWRQVRHRLERVGVIDLPEILPPGGYIGESPEYSTRVGVWLMPDNIQDGKLEDFLRTLIQDSDPIIAHAESSTAEAKARGATFSEPDHIKAVIHSWLAWQKEPGRPYGLAVKANYFGHSSPAAKIFVKWFLDLYQLH